MTTTSLFKSGVTPPTKLQLALALAVVKGKPPGQSVKGEANMQFLHSQTILLLTIYSRIYFADSTVH